MDRCSLVQMGKTKARSGDEICLETLSEVLPGLRSFLQRSALSSGAPLPHLRKEGAEVRPKFLEVRSFFVFRSAFLCTIQVRGD